MNFLLNDRNLPFFGSFFVFLVLLGLFWACPVFSKIVMVIIGSISLLTSNGGNNSIFGSKHCMPYGIFRIINGKKYKGS